MYFIIPFIFNAVHFNTNLRLNDFFIYGILDHLWEGELGPSAGVTKSSKQQGESELVVDVEPERNKQASKSKNFWCVSVINFAKIIDPKTGSVL